LARCVMVLGTTSGAGKSWLTTALCRYYARQGLKVAPFKAQNMSNNARVVPGPGNVMGEIGSAQYFQALAARAVPEVRMNPLLLKPEADTHSQVVLMGQVSAELTAMPWRGRSEKVWPQIAAALDALRFDNDVVVIEGAGSPAEINLHASDIVNMRVARHANALCLLVTDIDRGGAFAHLYGTWALLPEEERALIAGFVLNKFRGDAALLAPAPQMLQDLTGVPTVATIPMWWQHGLPEEDGVFDERSSVASAGVVHTTVAVIAYPRISNLDEFQPLKNLPGVRLLWVRSPANLAGLKPTDWVVLPGSKATASDLHWLRTQGLDGAIAAHAAQGGAVLGVCGGLQMLGEALIDPEGIDGNGPGLGLLPLVTLFEPTKTVRHTPARFAELAAGPWQKLSGVQVSGYEIHHGQTAQHPAMAAKGDVAREVLPGVAWQNTRGNVLGLYLHGLLEDPAALQALFGATSGAPVRTLDNVFDGLADALEAHFAPGVLSCLIQPCQP
jgi:adenosylcobyric acid synthase